MFKCPLSSFSFSLIFADVRRSVHMGAMVNIFRDMDSSIADICQERRSHNSEPTRQRDSLATIPGLMEVFFWKIIHNSRYFVSAHGL